MKIAIKITLVCLVAFVVAQRVLGLRCYSCFSSVSWDQCHNGNRSLTIEPCSKEKYCLTEYVRLKNGEQLYQKYCAPWGHCNATACSFSPMTDHCERACCQEDLCNGADQTALSGVLLLSCAVCVHYVFKFLWERPV